MTAPSLDVAGRIIARVVAAEVVRARLSGAVMASPPGRVSDLLRGWLSPLMGVRVPDAGAVADVAGALAAAGSPGDVVEALAWRSVAEAAGAAEGLLLVGSTNKTELLLDPRPLPARVLPLGDVWASTLGAEGRPAPVSPVLAYALPEEVRAVERALEDYLERGVDPDRAFAALGALERPVRCALDAAQGRRSGLLVPKLTSWTVGCDLAR
ncbi:MAG: hypothetical protein Q8N53_19260 [Longimicrobiales bacterium]|nr:hypothetical protein [Longimicrobiales bacterium]